MNRYFQNVFDLLVLFIVAVSFTSIVLLTLGYFKPGVALILGCLLGAIIYLALYSKDSVYTTYNIGSYNHVLAIAALLLIGLIFRINPYLYILGGQDQGVYVNMAILFQRNGTTFHEDKIRSKIKSQAEKSIYDKNNVSKLMVYESQFKEGEREGAYLPGVYIKDLKKSEYVFQFYHLHSIWMSIAAKLFGKEACVNSLTFFSLLSIIGFYFLTFELSSSLTLSFIVGLLIALNPLHAFFSKFPVTEVLALCFTSLSFYYLARYYNKALENLDKSIDLFLSAGLMGTFFFTRISGFMYLPYFYLLTLLNAFTVTGLRFQKNLNKYFLAVFLLYALSLAYGWVYSFPYSSDIYYFSFGKAFGPYWKIYISLFILTGILGYLIVRSMGKNYKFAIISRQVIKIAIRIAPYLLIFFLLFGFYKIYQLGFTDTYLNDPVVSKRWHLAGIGFKTVKYSSIGVSILYLSPLVFILFLTGAFKTQLDFFQKLSFFFILPFWAYISLMQWVVPYQYYYARYLLSEIVPYTILFTVLCLKPVLRKKGLLSKFITALIVLSCVYYGYYSFLQFKGNEAEGAYSSLKAVDEIVGPDDIILLDKQAGNSFLQIRMPLIYFFDKNVILFEGKEILNSILESDFITSFNDVFILTKSLIHSSHFTNLNMITFRRGFFEHTNRIPKNYFIHEDKFYVYKVNLANIIQAKADEKGIIRIKRWEKKEGFHTDHTWTRGDAVVGGLHFLLHDKQHLKLDLYGYHPYKNSPSRMGIQVFINDKEARWSHKKGKHYFFYIPEQVEIVRSIRLVSNTFVPAELGINNDNRRLGLDIKTIAFE